MLGFPQPLSLEIPFLVAVTLALSFSFFLFFSLPFFLFSS